MKRFLLIISAFLISACVKENNIEIEPLPQKIVVSSYISPQSQFITAIISLSAPNFQSGNFDQQQLRDKMKTALVTISDGTTDKVIPYNPLKGVFELPASAFPIVVGKHYTLKVVSADGKLKVEAETDIPLPVLQPKFEMKGFRTSTDGNKQELFLFEFSDRAGERNYYRLLGEVERFDPNTSPTYPSVRILGAQQLIMDTEIDGQRYSRIVPNEKSYAANGNFNNTYAGYFIACSEEYFKFYKSLENRPDGNDSGSPYDEPTNLYTNVKGGYGIFGGYNMQRVQAP